MSFMSFADLPPWAMLLSLAAHSAAGIGLGVLYFRSLWWNAAGSPEAAANDDIALMLGRFVLLGGLLTLASLEGALPLLMMALGVLIARSAMMRTIREAAP